MPLPDPGAHQPEGCREEHSEPLTITFEGEGTLITREVPEEEQEEVRLHYQNTADGEIVAIRQSEESCETPGPGTVTDQRSEVDEEKEETKAPLVNRSQGSREPDQP